MGMVTANQPKFAEKLIRLYKKNYNPPHCMSFYLANNYCFCTNHVSQIVHNNVFYRVPKYSNKFSLKLNVFKSSDVNTTLIPTFKITFYDANKKKVYSMMSQRFTQSKRYRFIKEVCYYKIDIWAFKVDKNLIVDSDCELESVSEESTSEDSMDSNSSDAYHELSESDSIPTTASISNTNGDDEDTATNDEFEDL